MADEAKFERAQQQIASQWEQFVKEQVGRAESAIAELGKLQAKGLTQLASGVDEAGRYAKESLALAERAASEWRRIALEATRRTADLLVPKQS